MWNNGERPKAKGHPVKVDEAWVKFKRDGDKAARDELIVAYSSMVRYTAGQMAMGMPAEVQPGDLETYGIFGLIDAMDRFDPDRGIKFETYAVTRIKGAILDGVRKMDWVPASVRRKIRHIEEAYRKLYTSTGRHPGDEEVADELGIPVEKFHEDLSQSSRSAMVYLDDTRHMEDSEGAVSPWSTVPDESAVDPFEATEWTLKRERLADAIRALNENERLVITLHYYQGLTLSEIARVVDLTPSRISQIHSKAVLKMRGQLSSERTMFA